MDIYKHITKRSKEYRACMIKFMHGQELNHSKPLSMKYVYKTSCRTPRNPILHCHETFQSISWPCFPSKNPVFGKEIWLRDTKVFCLSWPTGSNGALMINFGYYKEYSICRNVICIIKNKSKMSFTWILMFRIFMIIVRLKISYWSHALNVNIMNLAAGFIYVT